MKNFHRKSFYPGKLKIPWPSCGSRATSSDRRSSPWAHASCRRTTTRCGTGSSVDATHNPDLKSWVESANDPKTDFPIQNLPFGIFRSRNSKESPRGGVAIGDQILDLAALGVRTGTTLNGIAALGRPKWRALRKEISRLLSRKAFRPGTRRFVTPMRQAELFLPLAIGDYSDFFTGIHHATNMGKMLRPDNPLLPNYKWLPIG